MEEQAEEEDENKEEGKEEDNQQASQAHRVIICHNHMLINYNKKRTNKQMNIQQLFVSFYSIHAS